MSECRLCLGACDPEIHAATVAVHLALRKRLQVVLAPIVHGEWDTDAPPVPMAYSRPPKKHRKSKAVAA